MLDSIHGHYILGPRVQSGGTGFVSKKLYEKIVKETLETSYLYYGPDRVEHRTNVSTKNSSVHLVDSRIMSMLFLFKKPDDLEIQIYTWNSADIIFRIAQIIGSRKNITCLDYKRRNELDSFNLLHWSESKDLEFTSIGYSQNSGEVLERFTRVNFVGRLTFQKGIDRFLDLARKNPHLQFRIFGTGPFDWIVERNTAKYSNIEFFGYSKDVFQDFSERDVLVVPSRYFEGASLALLEALSKDSIAISTGIDILSSVRDEMHFFPEKDENFLKFAMKVIRSVS
jgi:glycosyltransferase involved in cell wall biosynthesis